MFFRLLHSKSSQRPFVLLSLRRHVQHLQNSVSCNVRDTSTDITHPHPRLTGIFLRESRLLRLQILGCHPCRQSKASRAPRRPTADAQWNHREPDAPANCPRRQVRVNRSRGAPLTIAPRTCSPCNSARGPSKCWLLARHLLLSHLAPSLTRANRDVQRRTDAMRSLHLQLPIFRARSLAEQQTWASRTPQVEATWTLEVRA